MSDLQERLKQIKRELTIAMMEGDEDLCAELTDEMLEIERALEEGE